jgi:general secretion pathway protein A
MYAHFYQLSENPFNLTPDPKFHYVNESTREAMASLLHGIKSRKGFITLIAEAGTGKTTLLKRIVDEIEGETQIVFVFNPGVSFDELLEFICTELGIETRACKRLHLLERLNQHLLEQLTAGRNVVVMIDEAQTLEDSVLEELRLLSNLETSKEKILQILLSGQPELEEKLRRPSLRQLRQRIGVRATLKPVQPGEMQAYVETRLRSAGAERADLFTPAALKRIWRASAGIPRVINVICDNAMMIAFADGQKRITPKTLNEAVRDLEGDGSQFGTASAIRAWLTSRSVGYALAAAAVVLAAIPLAGVVLRGLERGGPSESLRFDERSAAVASRIGDGSEGGNRGTQAPGNETAAEDAELPALAPDVPPAAGGEERGLYEFSESEELASRQALNSDPTQRQAITDSIRRAEIIARSTAARLYATGSPDRSGKPDLTDAALAEVARNRPLTGLEKQPASTAERAEVQQNEAVSNPAVDRAPLDPAPAPEPEKIESDDTLAATSDDARRRTKQSAEGAPAKVPAPEENKPAEPAGQVAAVAPAKAGTKKATSSTAPKSVAAAPKVEVRPPAMLGRSVRVEEGDTVWDIAIRYYGGAGPSTLKRILSNNPAIYDPLKLEVGSTVFLPFSRPDQMIAREGSGFRVLLASAPSRQGLAGLEAWARNLGGEIRIGKSEVDPGRQQYELYVAGLPSESAALDLATSLLERVTAMWASPQRTAMR